MGKEKKDRHVHIKIHTHTHTHSHILKHMTPTFKHMTPTHIKSLTHHSYKHSMGGGFTLPLLLCAYSKANSPALGFKEPGQPPAPRMARGGEGGGQEWKESRRRRQQWKNDITFPEMSPLSQALALAVYRGDIILLVPLPPLFSP